MIICGIYFWWNDNIFSSGKNKGTRGRLDEFIIAKHKMMCFQEFEKIDLF